MKKCWKMHPEDRPTFSNLVLSMDKTLTTVAGYVEFSMTLKQPESEEHQYEVMLSTGGTNDMDQHKLGENQYEVIQPAGGGTECKPEKTPSSDSGNVYMCK